MTVAGGKSRNADFIFIAAGDTTNPLNPPAKGRQNLLNLLNPGHPVAP